MRLNSMIVRLLLLLFLFHGGALLYLESLEGGSLAWIHQNLFRLAFLVISSSFASATALFLTCISPCSPKVKAAFVAYGIAIMCILLLSDQGDTELRHGGYNGMCWLFLVILLGIVYTVLYFSWRFMGLKLWAACWCSVIVTVICVSSQRLERGRALWPLGLGSERLEDSEGNGCRFNVPTNTWEDLLPPGTMNSWTGSQTCPRLPTFATLRNGILEINCTKGNSPIYQLLPRTEHNQWLKDREEEVSEFQKYVLENIKTAVYIEGRPHQVGEHEVVIAKCGDAENLLIQTVKNWTVVERVKNYYQSEEGKKVQQAERPRLNVLVLYFDALSRRHFHRKFPSTVSFLNGLKEDETSVAEPFEFYRYHSIGVTTSRNARSMFTGFSIRPSLAQYLDYYNKKKFPTNQEMAPKQGRPVPIWELYQQNGYVTAQVDNSCQEWEAKYLANVSNSWDHQFVAPFCLPEYFPLRNPHGNWVGPFAIRRRCLGGSQAHQWVVRYVDELWKSYEEVPKFSIAAFTEGHEGTSEVVGLLDEDIAHLLANSSISLNDTIVFLVSDHGLHMGLYFSMGAESALKENALPLWIGLFPKWYLDSLGDIASFNLHNNQQSLLSGYDLYATLTDLLGMPEERGQLRSKSLLEYIPHERNCDDALIPQERCICTPQ